MNYFNYDGVAENFMRITGISANDFAHSALLENAADYVVTHLSVSPESLNENQLLLCEYAAAAVAVYDYAFELCLKDRPVMSENGNVTLRNEDSSLLEKARLLRSEALNRLSAADLTEPQNFAFMGV